MKSAEAKEVKSDDVYHLARWAAGSFYSRLSYRVCRKAGVDMEDVVQDVCLYYYDKVHGRRAQDSSIGTIITKLTLWRLMRLDLISKRGGCRVKSNILEDAVKFICCSKWSNGQDSVDAQDFWENIEQLIPEQRDRDIVKMVLVYDYTNVDCGKHFGLSRERVRQIREKWLKILRDCVPAPHPDSN